MTELEKVKEAIKYETLKGDFIGTLKGILHCEIDKELREKITFKIKELENVSK